MATENPYDPKALADQYKAYMGDLSSIGSRYSAAQGFYMSVVSALIAFAAFAAKDSPFNKYVAATTAAVLVFVALVCLAWRGTLFFYRNLFAAKFVILKKIEQQGLYPMYQEEWTELQKRKATGLVMSEEKIPLIVGFAAVIGAIAALYLGFRS
jgi:hypothetical protein